VVAVEGPEPDRAGWVRVEQWTDTLGDRFDQSRDCNRWGGSEAFVDALEGRDGVQVGGVLVRVTDRRLGLEDEGQENLDEV
jgi:hypothetical protein